MSPLLLGHRGHRLARRARRRAVAGVAPENSLAAFEQALAAGCDGFELDLRLSRDGHIVIHHDARLESGHAIAHTDLRTLRRHAPRLATCEEMLRRFHRRAWVDLEVKAPGLEAALAELLRRYPLERGYVVSSFQRRILQRLAALGVEPLCLNLRHPHPLRTIQPGLGWIAPHQRLCTVRYVRRLQGAGWKVLVWTVNRPAKMRRLAEAGVEAIVSDDPALLVSTLAAEGRPQLRA